MIIRENILFTKYKEMKVKGNKFKNGYHNLAEVYLALKMNYKDAIRA